MLALRCVREDIRHKAENASVSRQYIHRWSDVIDVLFASSTASFVLRGEPHDKDVRWELEANIVPLSGGRFAQLSVWIDDEVMRVDSVTLLIYIHCHGTHCQSGTRIEFRSNPYITFHKSLLHGTPNAANACTRDLNNMQCTSHALKLRFVIARLFAISLITSNSGPHSRMRQRFLARVFLIHWRIGSVSFDSFGFFDSIAIKLAQNEKRDYNWWQ
jgi:hypothetical protein